MITLRELPGTASQLMKHLYFVKKFQISMQQLILIWMKLNQTSGSYYVGSGG